MESGLVVAEEMPDDHQDGSADRDDGFLLAASSGDPSVAFAEEGVGLAGADGGFTEDPGQVGIAVAGRPVALCRPADSLTPGANRAHEHRCAAVGNRVMSIPISARITQAACCPMPGISSSRAAASAKGAISASIRSSRAAMSASTWSIRASILDSKNPWWSLNRPVNASSSSRQLGPHPPSGQPGQHPRVALPGDQRRHHLPTGDPEDVGGHHRQLDAGVRAPRGAVV